jgi:hypothetical protein
VALGFFLLGVVFFFTPLWVVNVFGRRTRARVQFRLRERKARDVFARVCQAAAEAQRTLAVPAQAPEPPPLPLSSSEPPIAPD